MTTLLTVLTPIVPGREGDLDIALAELSAQESRLGDIGSVHFARWVVFGSPQGDFGRLSLRRRQLRMRYLLLNAAIDGSFEDFVEGLRTTARTLTNTIWGHCVGYPDPADRMAFHAYFAHNQLVVPHSYIAYHDTVREVSDALDLRERHLALARELQGSDADPLDAFRAMMLP